MINLKNYQNKLDDLKNVHRYISKKIIMLYIIFGFLQVIFLGGIIALAQIDPDGEKPIFIIGSVLLYLLSFLLFIPIIKLNRQFTQGNLREFIFDVVSNETNLYFEPLLSNKEYNLYVKENSNLLSSSSLSSNLIVNVYNETKEECIAKYSYIGITYNKYLSYSGYLIIIPSELATSDVKIFTKNFKSYAIEYKEDKENKNDLSYIYYNKKVEYKYNPLLTNLHREIDEYYNEYLSNKMSIGLLSKNNHLSIMFANNPKIHPNFLFKHKLTNEYLESLINAIIKDMDLIKRIYNK